MEQVRSGFRIGALLVLGFCFFIALQVSLSYMSGRVDPVKDVHRILGILASCALVTIMFMTTQYWAKWLVGILGLFLLRMSGPLAFKVLFTLGSIDILKNLPWDQLLLWFTYLLAAVALTARHASRKAAGLEKLGLVSFVVCVSLAMVYDSYKPLLVGLALLASAELAQRLMFHRKRHGHSRVASAPPLLGVQL